MVIQYQGTRATIPTCLGKTDPSWSSPFIHFPSNSLSGLAPSDQIVSVKAVELNL